MFNTKDETVRHIDRRWRYSFVAGLTVFCLGSFLFLVPNSSTAKRKTDAEALARSMLDSLGTTSGLCVHLGVQDGTLTTALSGGGRFLVHGLSASREAVERARRTIDSRGLAGVVSVEESSLGRLPYADHLVDLLVVDGLADLKRKGLQLDEVPRVLRPGGVAWLGQRAGAGGSPLTGEQLTGMMRDAGLDRFDVSESGGIWAKFIGPVRADMDEWTHPRHDASGNPVSKDKIVGVLSGVRWVAGPNWPTGYRKSAVPGVVASREQLVYVFEDEVQTAGGAVKQNSLIARDAYNGLFLWKRKTTKGRTPLVLVGERVYTVLEQNGPLVMLDAKTGRITHSYKQTRHPKQLILLDGLLVVELPEGMGCLDAETGRLKWRQPIRPTKLVAGDGHVYFHADASRRGGDSTFGCLDLKTGEKQWTKSTKSWCKGPVELVFYQAGVLVAAGPGGTHAVSAKDGSHLWGYKYPTISHGGSFAKVMYLGGLVWVHAAAFEGKKQYAWEGLDPLTGQVKKRVVQPADFLFKHRCSSDVATERYFLCGSLDIADLKTGAYRHFDAARNSCQFAGVLPANGLVYTFPHACGCAPWLRGFLGLATAEMYKADAAATSTIRLQTGPGYHTEIQNPKSKIQNSTDWPTYRHDTRRSGSTPARGPARLNTLWEHVVADVAHSPLTAQWDLKDGGRLSSPVVADRLAFVAASDDHRVWAFETDSGKPRWSYTAGGRVDCPPTITAGLCLFGARDGWVTCLQAQTGTLLWRFRAAPREKRIVAYGQLESPWPVTGGVLVFDGLAYFVAGRHADADGGVIVFAVEPRTGKLVWSKRPQGYPGVPDVLNGEGQSIQMASWQFDAKTGKDGGAAQTRLRGGRLGLLNDAWYKRPIALRKNLQLWSAGKDKSGQMLAFNESATCGYKACGSVDGGDGKLSGNAELFVHPAAGKKWSIKMPNTARLKGMVLAESRLYVAGRLYDGDFASNSVRSYSVVDGKPLDEHPVADQFVHDCLAVAGDRLYVTTAGGKLICLGPK